MSDAGGRLRCFALFKILVYLLSVVCRIPYAVLEFASYLPTVFVDIIGSVDLSHSTGQGRAGQGQCHSSKQCAKATTEIYVLQCVCLAIMRCRQSDSLYPSTSCTTYDG